MRLKKNLIPSLLIICIAYFSTAWAAPVKVNTCTACHGAKGISPSSIWPNLAGQKQAYLEKQLKDFKSGARKDPMMSPLAKSLSVDEIKALSKYFSKFK